MVSEVEVPLLEHESDYGNFYYNSTCSRRRKGLNIPTKTTFFVIDVILHCDRMDLAVFDSYRDF